MDDFLALCSRQTGNELIAAECENLTGGKPGANGLAGCRSLENVPRAAYILAGMRGIAGGETLSELCAAIQKSNFPADEFRIEFLRLSRKKQTRESEAVLAAANAIPARPNLDSPQHRFLLVETENGFVFGEVIVEPDRSYRRQDARPYRTTSSLPSRLARALVNLVTPPARSLIDPCCGTGSILIEARAIGLAATGVDQNYRMVRMTRGNLAYMGYQAEVFQTDARELKRTADAIVTDLPYGLSTEMEPANILGILKRAARLAPLGVFVAGRDISTWLQDAGYKNIETFHIRKHHRIFRYIHRAISNTSDS